MINIHENFSEAYKDAKEALDDHTFCSRKHTDFYAYECRAWYSFFKLNDLEQARQDFNSCTIINLKQMNSGVDLFSYNRNSPLYAAFSDNKETISAFSNVEYLIRSGPNKNKTNKQVAKKGKSHIYIDTIVKAMVGDEKGLSENLDIMESVFLRLKKNQPLLPDYDFFRGILTKNKDKIYESIVYLSTKAHKKRNRHSYYLKDVVSQPGAGFAKIAWMNEIELEFDNELIPNSLLPIAPLSVYENSVSGKP